MNTKDNKLYRHRWGKRANYRLTTSPVLSVTGKYLIYIYILFSSQSVFYGAVIMQSVQANLTDTSAQEGGSRDNQKGSNKITYFLIVHDALDLLLRQR
jgi:hypothetical protein